MVNKWDLIGKIQASGYRKKIMVSLAKDNKTPSNLSKETGIKLSHISRTIKELEDLELVVCLTTDLRKGKIYALTELGKETFEKL